MIKEITDRNEKMIIAKRVLDDLSEWFGIPEYTENYIIKSSDMPFFAVIVDDLPVGFASLKRTSDYAVDIFCMGILKKYHRYGLGGKLYYELERYAINSGYKFIQVKTVEMGRYDEYDRTNLFYKSMGFIEFEVFATLWDECNPCQIYIKAI